MKTQVAPTEPITFRVPTGWKRKAQAAAEYRDGGNLSRLVRRAVDRIIEEEQLLQSEEKVPA